MRRVLLKVELSLVIETACQHLGGNGTQDVKTEKVAGRWGQAQQRSQGISETEMTGKGEEKAGHHLGISDGRGSENDRNRKRNLGTSQLYFLGAPAHSPLEKTILGERGATNVPLYLNCWFRGWRRRQLFNRLVPRLAAMRMFQAWKVVCLHSEGE